MSADLDQSVQDPLLNQIASPKKYKYLDTNIFGSLWLSWIGDFIKAASLKPFQQEMHWDLREQDSSQEITSRLTDSFTRFGRSKHPLLRALFATNKWTFICALICLFTSECLLYAIPLLMRYIIDYVSHEEKDLKYGLGLVLGVICSRIAFVALHTYSELLHKILGIKTSNALNGVMFEKTLRFSLIRSSEHSQGSIVNYFEADSQKLYELAKYFNFGVVLPLLLILGIYFMYYAVGISFLGGIAIILSMVAINMLISSRFQNVQTSIMKIKDARMKLTTEVISGIKYIKMSGLEEIFLDKLDEVRHKELKQLRRLYMLFNFLSLSAWLTPIMITGTIFAIYTFTGHSIDAKGAFTLISALSIIQSSVKWLPMIISEITNFRVSIKRIKKFLYAEEVNLSYITSSFSGESESAVKMENGNFFWLSRQQQYDKDANNNEHTGKEDLIDPQRAAKNQDVDGIRSDSVVVSSEYPKPQGQDKIDTLAKIEETGQNKETKLILKDLNFKINRGSFIAIFGEVGCGKSSLLLSLLGEMGYDLDNPPKLNVSGSLCYVAQHPWILNTSIKNNIISDQDFDLARYCDVIKYSFLQPDIDVMINADDTEIGEEGINLSGGQKARVSLARALYRDADIYLLDDLLSAVDAHVGNYILNECILGYLKNKTRILVTHNFEVLKHTDYVFVIKEGKIVEADTYQNLKEDALFNQIRENQSKLNNDDNESHQEGDKDSKVQIQGGLQTEESVKVKSHLEEKEDIMNITKQRREKSTEVKGEDQKILEEKLMLDEDREVRGVSRKVWLSFFRHYGGVWKVTLIFFIMTCSMTLRVGTDVWLSRWSDDPGMLHLSKEAYFGIYCALGAGEALFNFINSLTLYLQSLKSSRVIHNDMIGRIVRAPLNLFFDRIPTGRLLNRFSGDLQAVDQSLTQYTEYYLIALFLVLGDVIVCVVVGTVWILPIVVITFFACRYLRNRFMILNREVVRLESISKSPIVSLVSQSIHGLPSIRAHKDEARFIEKFHHIQNEHIKNIVLSACVANWFSLRVIFSTLLILIPTLIIPIVFNE